MSVVPLIVCPSGEAGFDGPGFRAAVERFVCPLTGEPTQPWSRTESQNQEIIEVSTRRCPAPCEAEWSLYGPFEVQWHSQAVRIVIPDEAL